MSQPGISTEALYQISLAIGNRLNLEEMLAETLGVYLQCIQAVSGELYFVERTRDGRYGFRRSYGFQRLNGNQITPGSEILSTLPTADSESAIHTFLESLPRVVQDAQNAHVHLMELPGVGMLMLTTTDKPLEKATVKSLAAINRKLAEACLNCLNHRQLKITHNRLTKHNQHLSERNHLLNAAREELSTIINNAHTMTAAMRKWERNLQKIMGNAMDLSFSLDAGGVITKISSKISEFTDFTAEELTGKPVQSLFFDETEKAELCALLKKNGQVKAYEAHFINKNGHLLYICLGVYAIFDARGSVCGYNGVLTDLREWEIPADTLNMNVTALERIYRRRKISTRQIEEEMAQRRQAELAAQKAASLNAEIVSMISQILINVDENDRINHWNSVAERVTGIPAASVVGQPFLKCGVKWDWDKMVKTISICTEEERQVRLKHFSFKRPDASTGWLDLTIRPFLDENRHHSGIIIVGEELPDN